MPGPTSSRSVVLTEAAVPRRSRPTIGPFTAAIRRMPPLIRHCGYCAMDRLARLPRSDARGRPRATRVGAAWTLGTARLTADRVESTSQRVGRSWHLQRCWSTQGVDGSGGTIVALTRHAESIDRFSGLVSSAVRGRRDDHLCHRGRPFELFLTRAVGSRGTAEWRPLGLPTHEFFRFRAQASWRSSSDLSV